MPNYRRAKDAGATYLFTVCTQHRQPLLTQEPFRIALRQAIERTRTTRPFTIDAWVLLPDHLHCLWTLPADDGDFSARWAMIKQYTSKLCREHLAQRGLPVSRHKRHTNSGFGNVDFGNTASVMRKTSANTLTTFTGIRSNTAMSSV